MLCNSEVVTTHEINLTKYIGNDEVNESMKFEGKIVTIENLTFSIEMIEMIDETSGAKPDYQKII